MTSFKYKKILCLYIISFLIMIIMGIYLRKSISNKLVVFDDKEQVIQYSSNSIPVKIELYSKRWGKTSITYNNSLKEFWDIVESMPRSKNFYGSTKIENSPNDIIGTIFYLNGKRSTMCLNHNLKIDDSYYGGERGYAYINRLRNYINDIMCTPSMLASIVNDKNKVIIEDKLSEASKCGSNDKTLIKNEITKLRRISNNEKLQKTITSKGKLNYHIKIYMENSNGSNINLSKIKQDNYDIISISVYENNCAVIRDYGNDTVDTFCMEGNLTNVCKSILKR
ncbi:DUF3919 family protein [Clostridium novyi]|uniref:DUF3919 domain-containing protein n=1 Tax=Clostridium novyi (strain NT) TaxID=386415 RepID=A0PYC2_CLONN|nr:DUF3919 family protein [Clostridium novyi]ABK60919.1 conserved hypothetical protein [Clostridium novyi NT]KEH87822.1 hypothetical protein Z966_09485 [Clostridium novyi A str. NCTC 538]